MTLVDTAAELLGEPLAFVADRGWADGEAIVVEVEREGGPRLIVKQHGRDLLHEREVHAYRRWVPAIAERAPRLLASDAAHRVVVVTKLPGVTAPGDRVEVHRDAGAVLRRYQGAEDGGVDRDWGAAKVEHLEKWVARAPEGLLDGAVVTWARSRVAALDGLEQALVPVHSDWWSRNWLWDGSQVGVIDFERSHLDSWLHDLQRLRWREWLDRPDLADAFFDGYGRALTDDEREVLEIFSSVEQVTTMVWATEVGSDAFVDEARRNVERAMAGA
ncbi:MAG TPA: aminoglycoside phosphotransferase family protein [Acidimicrobiales bacterium]|nr:aminoglycoside phosphotransferase family protein [Acidimicrobiales bacterium]